LWKILLDNSTKGDAEFSIPFFLIRTQRYADYVLSAAAKTGRRRFSQIKSVSQ